MKKTTAPTKTLIEIAAGHVSGMALIETIDGPALDPQATFEDIGNVRRCLEPGKRGEIVVWRWETPTAAGAADTKGAAIQDTLTAHNLVAVPLTATIPDLTELAGTRP